MSDNKKAMIIISISSICLGLFLWYFLVFYNTNNTNYINYINYNLHDVIYNGNLKILEDILPPEKLEDLTPAELRILRNTIYAKYGYDFTSTDLVEHFSQFDWYTNEGEDVDEKLSEIDKLNVTMIQYFERNPSEPREKTTLSLMRYFERSPSAPATKITFFLRNPFTNKSPATSAMIISEPVFDFEIILSNQNYGKTFSRYILGDNDDSLGKFIQNITADANITQDEINLLFIGGNFTYMYGDYIMVFDIKNKNFSLNNNLQNYSIQKDRYNNDILFITNSREWFFLCYTGQKLFLSGNKDLIYEFAYGNLSKRYSYLNGDIDLYITSNSANLNLWEFPPSANLNYIFFSIKGDENYTVSAIIVNNNIDSAQEIYDTINGYKKTMTDPSELGNRMVVPTGDEASIYSMLREADIKLDNNNVEIIMPLDKSQVNGLLQLR